MTSWSASMIHMPVLYRTLKLLHLGCTDMAKDKTFNLEIVDDHSGETVFLLELVDLVEEFECACKKVLPEEERFDLLRQLFILLESHRPDDLASRQLLFYDLMPTLLS